MVLGKRDKFYNWGIFLKIKLKYKNCKLILYLEMKYEIRDNNDIYFYIILIIKETFLYYLLFKSE